MRKFVTTGIALSLIVVAHTCKQPRDSAHYPDKRQNLEPVIEIAPLEQGDGQWKIAADRVTVAVTAPGAERVRILGRPQGVEEAYLELLTLATPVDRAEGRFTTGLNLTPDFTGHVWAEAIYPDGAKKWTETIALTVDAADAGADAQFDAVGGSVGTDESARSDKLTGGRIRRSRLISGEPGIRITVNAPAFRLTLWQNGKEVSAYYIGIGRKDFPIPVGEREASAIIFNPQWVPPGSAWAPRADGASPDDGIWRNDPRPLLSKIRIPLGSGYAIHQAAKADDIGRAVSTGCIVMLGEDLLDLARKIGMARNPPATKSWIARLRESPERLAMALDPPLLVDINYDLQVVEGGALHVYPDVYERGAFALDSLRAELQTAGVAPPLLEDRALQRILDRVSADTQFVINVADIMKGRSRRGRNLPLTDRSIEKRREIAFMAGRYRPGAPSARYSSSLR